MKKILLEILRKTSIHIVALWILFSGVVLYWYTFPNSSTPINEFTNWRYTQLFAKIYQTCPTDKWLQWFDANNNPICVDIYKYSWQTTSWWSCSVSCWWWTQSRTVTCKRSDWANQADSICISKVWSKPTTSQSCNTQNCPINWNCWLTKWTCDNWTSIWTNNTNSCNTTATWKCLWLYWWSNVNCSKFNWVCPTCTDGVKNWTETWIDCGWSCGSCLSCTPQNIAWYTNTAKAAGWNATYTSNMYSFPVKFTFDLWSEDLIYNIVCYNKDWSVKNSWSGWWKDDSWDIDHFKWNCTAYKIYLKVTEWWWQSTDSLWYNLKWNILCPENWVCGSANWSAFKTEPTTNLCTDWSPSSVSLWNYFTWNCYWLNWWSNTMCSASYLPVNDLKLVSCAWPNWNVNAQCNVNCPSGFSLVNKVNISSYDNWTWVWLCNKNTSNLDLILARCSWSDWDANSKCNTSCPTWYTLLNKVDVSSYDNWSAVWICKKNSSMFDFTLTSSTSTPTCPSWKTLINYVNISSYTYWTRVWLCY